jgi:hypothetical protein
MSVDLFLWCVNTRTSGIKTDAFFSMFLVFRFVRIVPHVGTRSNFPDTPRFLSVLRMDVLLHDDDNLTSKGLIQLLKANTSVPIENAHANYRDCSLLVLYRTVLATAMWLSMEEHYTDEHVSYL